MLLFVTVLLVVNLASYYLLYRSLSSLSDNQWHTWRVFFKTFVAIQFSLTILINVVLMYSVSRIRNSIKNKEYIFPNEKLIVIHLINYFISSVFSIVQTVMLYVVI